MLGYFAIRINVAQTHNGLCADITDVAFTMSDDNRDLRATHSIEE